MSHLFTLYFLVAQLLGLDLPSTREIHLAPFSLQNKPLRRAFKVTVRNGVHISGSVDPRPTKGFTVCIRALLLL